jgi:hypothetical protein
VFVLEDIFEFDLEYGGDYRMEMIYTGGLHVMHDISPPQDRALPTAGGGEHRRDCGVVSVWRFRYREVVTHRERP